MSITIAARRLLRAPSSLSFLAGGIGTGSWAACLPALSRSKALDPFDLGMVLLCFALGAMFSMMNASRMVPRLGTGLLSFIGAVVFGITLALVPHITGLVPLAAVVMLSGAGFGTLDVTMNTQASFIEQRVGRRMMSSFHAIFSLGNLLGAGICGQILLSGGDLATCLGVAGATVVTLAAIAWLRSDPDAKLPHLTRGHARPNLNALQQRHLFWLGLFAFLALFAEGALMDWSAIYMVTAAGASQSTGAFGFAVFSGTMAIGRTIGDVLNTALGPARFMRIGVIFAACSLALILVFPFVPVIFVALVFTALGVANAVPTMFAAAGRIGGAAAAAAMARVTTFGYTGLLIGPPFVGFVAQMTSLRIALCAVVAALLVVSTGAWLLRVEKRHLDAA